MNTFPSAIFWSAGILLVFLFYEITVCFLFSKLITTEKISLLSIASAQLLAFRKFIIWIFPMLFYRELFNGIDSYILQIMYSTLCLGTFFYAIYSYANEFTKILFEHFKEPKLRSYVHFFLPIIILVIYIYTIFK